MKKGFPPGYWKAFALCWLGIIIMNIPILGLGNFFIKNVVGVQVSRMQDAYKKDSNSYTELKPFVYKFFRYLPVVFLSWNIIFTVILIGLFILLQQELANF